MGRRATLVALPLVAALAACSAPGGTAAEPGWSPVPSRDFTASVSRAAPAWSLDVGSDPAVLGGGIVARDGWFVLAKAGVDGTVPVAAVVAGDAVRGRLDTGRLMVRGAIGQPLTFDVAGSPVTTVPVREHPADPASPVELVAYDPRSARMLWRVPAQLRDSPAATSYLHLWGSAGDLAVGQVLGDVPAARRCGVCAVDLGTGRVAWSFPGRTDAASQSIGTVEVGPGLTAATLDGGRRLVVLDTRTGRLRFSVPTSRPGTVLWPTVVGLGDLLLSTAAGASDTSGTVTVLDAAGRVRWSAPTFAAPAADPQTGTVVLLDAAGEVQVRDASSGAVRWTLDAARVARDGVVVNFAELGRVVAMSAGQVVAWDARTGAPLWAGTFARADPAHWDGHRYLGWSSPSVLSAYAAAAPPLGVDIGGPGEIPLFLGPPAHGQ